MIWGSITLSRPRVMSKFTLLLAIPLSNRRSRTAKDDFSGRDAVKQEMNQETEKVSSFTLCLSKALMTWGITSNWLKIRERMAA